MDRKIYWIIPICLAAGLLAAFTLPPLPPIITSNNPLPGGLTSTTPDSSSLAFLTPSYSGCGGEVAPPVNEAYEQQVVELVNQERAARDIPPLKRVSPLGDSARYHATDLGQDDYFDHDTYDRNGGTLIYVCDTWERIAGYYSGARGENIAAGYDSPMSVMNGWMNSSGHRANILGTNSWEIGVGYFEGAGSYGRYWVQNFGLRRDVYPLVINGEQADTDQRDISVYMYGSWDEVRLRNNDESWSNWLPFQNQLTWQLPNQVGMHTVSAEMRTGDKLVSNEDRIYLNTATSTAELSNLPETVSFYYELPEQRSIPKNTQVLPLTGSSQEILEWQLTQQGDWFSVSPEAGQTGDAITITPTAFLTETSDTMTGWVTITVEAETPVLGSPHTIQLYLYPVSGKLSQVFLPSLVSGP